MWKDVVQLAFRAIRRNVLRSALTVLGIVIGVAAVILMVTLGAGATARVTDSIASLGNNVLVIVPGHGGGPDATAGAPFTNQDAEAIAHEIHSLSHVAPISSASTVAVVGNESWSTTVTGTTAEFFAIRNWSVAQGRAFGDAEVRGGRGVCVIGSTVRKKLFPAEDPLGKRIRLNKVGCQVIGVLSAKGQSLVGSDQDDTIVMPIHAVQRRLTGNEDVALMQVTAREGVSTARAQQEITSLLHVRRHIAPHQKDDFQVNDLAQISSMVTNITGILTLLLGAVAGISLLVGGIGIMNIMLVSVTERTREIGTRLAIGAMARDVMSQFLVESVVLSSFGGVLGIALAIAAAYGATAALGIPFIFQGPTVLLAFAFSAAVGVIFGYFPARRASRLDPIVALRHE